MAVGMHVALRMYEKRPFSKEVQNLYAGTSFEGVLAGVELVRLTETGAVSRDVFNKHINTYFYFLWFFGWVGLFVYGIFLLSC